MGTTLAKKTVKRMFWIHLVTVSARAKELSMTYITTTLLSPVLCLKLSIKLIRKSMSCNWLLWLVPMSKVPFSLLFLKILTSQENLNVQPLSLMSKLKRTRKSIEWSKSSFQEVYIHYIEVNIEIKMILTHFANWKCWRGWQVSLLELACVPAFWNR